MAVQRTTIKIVKVIRLIRFLLVLIGAMFIVTVRRLARGPVHPLFFWRKELVAHILRRGIQEGLNLPLAVARRRLPPAPIPRSLTGLVHHATGGKLAGRRVELMTPDGWREGLPEVLYLHGGGYVSCSPATHRELVARIAAASGARCHALDYRLAPEDPFPAALDDCVAAYHELLARGSEPGRLLLAGDSAGGGLAVAMLVRLRQEGAPLPAGAALLSPWVDLSCAGESLQANARYCYLVPAALELYAALYLQETDADEPLASPLRADLTGLPPLLIQTGSVEGIHSEILELARRATEAGVQTTLQVGEGMFHVWQAFARVLPEGLPYIDRIGEFIRSRCAR